MAAPIDITDGNDIVSSFVEVYDVLKADILSDPSISYSEEGCKWVYKMLDYNVLGGKLNRGLAVVESYKILKSESTVSKDEFFLGAVLGWCIEWLQAFFLVMDDDMDDSHTRRGKPCWFRLEKVGSIALNDGSLLRSQIGRLLKKYFRNKPYYVDLLELFNEVDFQTGYGSLIDLITANKRNTDLATYNMPIYFQIVQNKTAYYSFYLPVACALLIDGKNPDDYGSLKKILVQMGTYFQVQDDYIDCFGDPAVTGKIGSDIEDCKCSWLVVQALQQANESQLQCLYANYGKSDSECVSAVKSLYKELGLQICGFFFLRHDEFMKYEKTSYNEIISLIEAEKSEPVKLMLKTFLHKIYNRQK